MRIKDKQIIQLIKNSGAIRAADYAKHFNASVETAGQRLRRMDKAGTIVMEKGSTKRDYLYLMPDKFQLDLSRPDELYEAMLKYMRSVDHKALRSFNVNVGGKQITGPGHRSGYRNALKILSEMNQEGLI